MASKKIVLTFPKDLIDKPIIYKLIKDYDLGFNILRANITPDQEGHMALEVTGEGANIERGIKYLKEQGLHTEPLAKDIQVDWDICVQCGACVGICPTAALYIKDERTMEVAFDTEKCIACELCIRPCPPRAIKLRF